MSEVHIGEPIDGTSYAHGQEVQHLAKLDCPHRCDIPPGLRLAQVVAPGTSFSTACLDDCGIALRLVTAVSFRDQAGFLQPERR